MTVKKVLVLGGSGQLGQSIEAVSKKYPKNEFVYLSSSEADITDTESLAGIFQKHQPDAVVNCAAFTAVDIAETKADKANAINGYAMKGVAELCKKHDALLLHVSTDFVFGEVAPLPLKEEDETLPLGVYGASKLLGEKLIQESADRYFIIRTSWLYSEFQNNFLKTMLRLGAERDSLSVVFDQVGTPTYAVDLAECILQIIDSGSDKYGVYHYSNEGVASWYDFAFEIFRQKNINIDLKPILSIEYPTPAKRPNYSVLNKEKIKNKLDIRIDHWTVALQRCLKNL